MKAPEKEFGRAPPSNLSFSFGEVHSQTCIRGRAPPSAAATGFSRDGGCDRRTAASTTTTAPGSTVEAADRPVRRRLCVRDRDFPLPWEGVDRECENHVAPRRRETTVSPAAGRRAVPIVNFLPGPIVPGNARWNAE